VGIRHADQENKMKTAKWMMLLAVGIVTIALASPVLAGNGKGSGSGKGAQLKDGSCGTGTGTCTAPGTGTGQQLKKRDGTGAGTGGQRLQDGSCTAR
jgi:hypothetical protein